MGKNDEKLRESKTKRKKQNNIRQIKLGVDGIERLDVGTPPLHEQLDAFVARRDFGMKDLQALPVHLLPPPETGSRPAGPGAQRAIVNRVGNTERDQPKHAGKNQSPSFASGERSAE